MILKDSKLLSFFAVVAVVLMAGASFVHAETTTIDEITLDTVVTENADEPALADDPKPMGVIAADSSAPLVAPDKTPMFFSIQEGNENDNMARKALQRVLQRSETEVGRHIPLGIARVDLNDDGILELFVRLLDQDLFCKQDDCQVYGFAVTDGGFIKIADLKSRTIDVLNDKTGGTKDLYVKMTDETNKTYAWDGKEYVLSSPALKKETGGDE